MDAIILCAGKGTRMNLNVPKCTIKINNKAIINHIIDCLNKTIINNIIVVVGYQKEKVIETINNKSIIFVEQKEALGTANAIISTINILKELKTKDVLIISGDTLIDFDVINQFTLNYISNKHIFSILTMNTINPTGFGRIIKNKENNIIDIIEEKEINNDYIRNINEINVGIYLINTKLLLKNIFKIKNNNQKKEYYLTDLVKIIKNKKITSFNIKYDLKLLGVNDLNQLNNLIDLLKD